MPRHLEYRLADRNLKTIFRDRVSKNAENIDAAYSDKPNILTLKGNQVKDYLKNLIGLLQKAFLELSLEDDAYTIGILFRFIKDFEVLLQMKDNYHIDGWKGGLPTFDDMLSLDIDKRTGLPYYGELKTMIDQVKDSKEFDKEDINKYFKEWMISLNKLTQYDYISLLNLSNKKSLSEVNVEKIKEIPEAETLISQKMVKELGTKRKIKGIAAIEINHYGYNMGGGIEVITTKIVSDKMMPETGGFFNNFLKIKHPVTKNEKGEVVLDEHFGRIFGDLVINDTRFIKNQISELFFREYDISEGIFFDFMTILSIGVKTPYNNFDKEFFPELDYDNKNKYELVIRKQYIDNNKVSYMIV